MDDIIFGFVFEERGDLIKMSYLSLVFSYLTFLFNDTLASSYHKYVSIETFDKTALIMINKRIH